MGYHGAKNSSLKYERLYQQGGHTKVINNAKYHVGNTIGKKLCICVVHYVITSVYLVKQ